MLSLVVHVVSGLAECLTSVTISGVRLQFLRQGELDRHLANCASLKSKDAMSASEESGDWLNEGGYEPAESSGS